MMILIEDLRTRIGLDSADSSRDVELQAAYDIALAMIENYCDRKFELKPDTEYFTHRAAYSFSLRRYPIIQITAVTDSINPNIKMSYHVDEDTGTLFFDGRYLTHKTQVDYEGGYDDTTLPADLEWALLHIFDVVWADMDSTTGSGSTGAIKQAKIGDLSLSFDTGSGSTSLITDSFITSPIANILGNYRRWYV